MTMSSSDGFAERLARVQANKGRSLILVGQDESFFHERKQPMQVTRGAEVAGNMAYPASLGGAFLLGMLAVVLGHYARFHVMSGHSALQDSDLEMILAAFIGICIAFTLSQMFRLTSKPHKAMQSAGVFLMVCTFHNLFFWMPGPMQLAFSPDYVAQSTLNAVPNSFLFSGNYLPFAAPSEAPAVDAPLAETAPAAENGDSAGDAAACAAEPAVRRLETTGERRKTVAANVAPPACPPVETP